MVVGVGGQEVFVLLVVDIPGVVGAAGKFVETGGLLGLEVVEVGLKLRDFLGEPAQSRHVRWM